MCEQALGFLPAPSIRLPFACAFISFKASLSPKHLSAFSLPQGLNCSAYKHGGGLPLPTITFIMPRPHPLLVVATACLSLLSTLVSSHIVITYPGMRGDNLHTTGNITGFNGSDVVGTNGLGVGSDNTYPYGMQWIYPCTFSSSVCLWA